MKNDVRPNIVEDFIKIGDSTGKSPSYPAKLNGSSATYQLKKSNSTSTKRSFINLDPDKADIIGEFLASNIAKNLHPNKGIVEIIPDVEVITDEAKKDIRIASKYLNCTNESCEGMSIDDLFKKITGNFSNDKKNRPMVTNDLTKIDDKKYIVLDHEYSFTDKSGAQKQMKVDKKQFYDMMALSIVLCDHDVNPGNFFVIKNNGSLESENQYNVGRLDFGHAFNDLIKRFYIGDHEPGKECSNGGIVNDFINRTKVNGSPITSESKLNKFYDKKSMLADPDFHNALRNVDKNNIIETAVQDSFSKLQDFWKNEIAYKRKEDDIKKSLGTLCRRVKDGYKRNTEQSNTNLIENSKKLITEFIGDNLNEAKQIADTLALEYASVRTRRNAFHQRVSNETVNLGNEIDVQTRPRSNTLNQASNNTVNLEDEVGTQTRPRGNTVYRKANQETNVSSLGEKIDLNTISAIYKNVSMSSSSQKESKIDSVARNTVKSKSTEKQSDSMYKY